MDLTNTTYAPQAPTQPLTPLKIAADTWQRSTLVRGAEHPDTLACGWNAVLDGGDEEARHQAMAALVKAYGEGHPILAHVAAGDRLETDLDLPPL